MYDMLQVTHTYTHTHTHSQGFAQSLFSWVVVSALLREVSKQGRGGQIWLELIQGDFPTLKASAAFVASRVDDQIVVSVHVEGRD